MQNFSIVYGIIIEKVENHRRKKVKLKDYEKAETTNIDFKIDLET